MKNRVKGNAEVYTTDSYCNKTLPISRRQTVATNFTLLTLSDSNFLSLESSFFSSCFEKFLQLSSVSMSIL